MKGTKEKSDKQKEALQKKRGDLEKARGVLVGEVELMETSILLKEKKAAGLALAKEYRLNKERIRLLLREKIITPDEAARLLSALKLAKNQCC
ncbi:hypothetical protein JXM67_05585 [candidate division WOR-3 bacterium]|nr:hypothetical protein [candidate division WOR-3 bacterium]